MVTILYKLVEIIAFLHEKILSWNDNFEYNLTDKELHFIVIGIFGMLMLLLVHPLFKFLVEKKMLWAVSWIYVVTILIVITFSIEIGQRITQTGSMDFRDIIYGMGGFFLMFGVFFIIRTVVLLILKYCFKGKEAQQANN